MHVYNTNITTQSLPSMDAISSKQIYAVMYKIKLN